MIFKSYVDESGTHRESLNLVLAGYVATTDQWSSFETEWKSALIEFGINFFHMADFANKAPPYNTWTKYERGIRFKRLIEIINNHITCSVGVILPKLEYAAAMGKAYRFIPGHAYGFAANYLAAQVPSALIGYFQDYDSKIAYVFDAGVEYQSEVIKSIKDALNDEMMNVLRIMSVSTQRAKDCMPLQAADILAYELYRLGPHLANVKTYVPGTKHAPRMEHINMLRAKPTNWEYLNESRIRISTFRTRNIVVPDLTAKRKI
jgi:hypothetical protein